MKVLLISNGPYNKINYLYEHLAQFYSVHKIGVEKVASSNFIVKYLDRLLAKLRIPLKFKFNSNIRNIVKSKGFDLIIVIKGNYLFPNTLSTIKKHQVCPIINWSPDNMFLKHNNTYWYIKNLSEYKIVYTTKIRNIVNKELESLGAQRVEFVYQSYSSIYHKRNKNGKMYDVLFIGSYEIKRYQYLKYLADNSLEVTIFGNGWESIKPKQNLHPFLNVMNAPLIDSAYTEAISAAKICLCFLREKNFDTHTARSVEIPAIGSFMLGEKSPEHSKMFKEGREADYFDNKHELVEKVKYYLKNQNEREKIANLGYDACMKGDYNFDNLINRIIEDAKS